MIQRLKKLIDSMKGNKVIQEETVSTTVDDAKEGKRITFPKEDVRNMLIKLGLLEEPRPQSNETHPTQKKP